MRTALLAACLLAAGCAPAGPADPPARAPEAVAAASQPAPAPTAGEDKVKKTRSEWREILTPEQFRILREAGTERPFSGEYDHVFTPGTYRCVGCDQVLFLSDHKYDSGCGWPAFWQPADETAVTEHEDRSHGMVRTEVVCSRCDGHLGHVFEDGPEPTGLRYCINSACLRLVPFEDAPDGAD